MRPLSDFFVQKHAMNERQIMITTLKHEKSPGQEIREGNTH